MALYDYHYSIKLEYDDAPFYALLMAAMKKADTNNSQLLKDAFPEVWSELLARYQQPLGVLESDNVPEIEMVFLASRLRAVVGVKRHD